MSVGNSKLSERSNLSIEKKELRGLIQDSVRLSKAMRMLLIFPRINLKKMASV